MSCISQNYIITAAVLIKLCTAADSEVKLNFAQSVYNINRNFRNDFSS